MIQSSKEYKKIHGEMQLNVFALLITAVEEQNNQKKIEEFLTNSEILSSTIYRMLFNYTQKSMPENHITFLSKIKNKILINSFSLEKLQEKAKELKEFSQKMVPENQEALRRLCSLI